MISAEFCQITSEPIKPEPVDITGLIGNLSSEHADLLAAINTQAEEQFNEAKVSDEQVQEAATALAEFYIDLYDTDTQDALRYLGYSSGLHSLSASEAGDTAKEEPNPYFKQKSPDLAFTAINHAVMKECHSAGLNSETIDQIRQILVDEYSDFSQTIASNLITKLGRFTRVARAFGSPDVLRAEGEDAALAYVEELRDSLESLGDRPERIRAFGRMVKKLTNGDTAMNQEEFDSYARRKIERYKQRSETDLLDQYAKNAMLYYAKAIYGIRPIILTKGLNSDPTYLFDSFEASRLGKRIQTRPELPREYVKSRIEKEIKQLCYGDTKIGKIIDEGVISGYQRDERRYRKVRYQEDVKFNWQTRTKAPENERVIRPETSSAPSVTGLDERQKQLLIDLSQMIGTIPHHKMSSDFIENINGLKKDYIGRLKLLGDEAQVLEDIIKHALRELHPDVRPNDDEATELFKFYNVIRDYVRKSKK